ncbi:MAG: hypothetical protein EON56_06320 [Alphaproteobacteria bacterium]|nr:MAG: hypothetical protein EON56_06320 [Alphaproteobacteria bacterium]
MNPPSLPGPDQVLDHALQRPAAVEFAYLMKRAADHRLLADARAGDNSRALHLRFVKAYEERAHAVNLVDQD